MKDEVRVIHVWERNGEGTMSKKVIGVWHECKDEVDSGASIGYEGERWFIQIEDYGDRVSIKHCPFCGVQLSEQ